MVVNEDNLITDQESNKKKLNPPVSDDIENVKFKLDVAQKMLKNKEETLQILEESLKFSRNQVSELTQCCNNLKNDRDSKEAEVLNLQQAITFHINTINELQKERVEHGSINDDFNFYSELEIEKYKYDIESLKFDLEVMEDLYKISTEEMIKQEKIINSLRQAYLDHRENEINLTTDNLLLSKLNAKNNLIHCQMCYERTLSLKEIENDLYNFNSELRALKSVLEKDDLLRSQRENSVLIQENTNLNVQIKKLTNISKTFQNKYKKIRRTQHNFNKLKLKLKNIKGTLKNKINLNSTLLKQDTTNKQMLGSLQSEIIYLKRFKIENVHLKNEIIELKTNVAELELKLNECAENNVRLQLELNNAEKSLKNLNEKYDDKSDSIVWLELQLSESSMRGTDLCNKSQEVFEFVQKLLRQTKDERKFLMKKIKMLQNVNKLLTLNHDYSNFGKNCDFYIDN